MIGLIVDPKLQSFVYDEIIFTKRGNYYVSKNNEPFHRYIYRVYVLKAQATCKYTDEKYVIHHMDENPFNNLVCNLLKMKPGEHSSLHSRGRRMKKDKNSRRARIIMGLDDEGTYNINNAVTDIYFNGVIKGVEINLSLIPKNVKTIKINERLC